GCSLGVDPVSDEVYMSLYHEFGTPTYITRRYSPDGRIIKDYPMIMNYWFPSLPLFPQGAKNQTSLPLQSGMSDIRLELCGGCVRVTGARGYVAEIYSVTGCKVSQVRIDNDSQILIMPDNRGVYIVRVGHATIKVMQ
ncbi:MAG: T9SS type A sorting domain-containing protein, partial [Muribaculaceae bacterium]|nr:T9SS type A sorting domain-containing protein [Muribaculaceae bacterium]